MTVETDTPPLPGVAAQAEGGGTDDKHHAHHADPAAITTFAKGLARPFTDSRRRNFITDMLTGLVAAGHVHLTAVARGISRGAGNIHAVEKRLSRNLASEHWEADPLAEELLQRSAALVTEDTLIPGDTTDLAKYYAKHLEGLGRVHDGSDPEGRTAPGYCVFEAYVRVGNGSSSHCWSNR